VFCSLRMGDSLDFDHTFGAMVRLPEKW
jgi:hypothetical protein